MFSLLWSEHCAYKHSKKLLRTLPTEGPRGRHGAGRERGRGRRRRRPGVRLQGRVAQPPERGRALPGRGHRRRRHPARHLRHRRAADRRARLAALRRADSASARATCSTTRSRASATTATRSACRRSAARSTSRRPYETNCLVNAMALGLARAATDLIRSAAAGVGNVVVLFGASTGRDGIGGASVLASRRARRGRRRDKRPTVQVGDPFEEKKLLECSLELLEPRAARLAAGPRRGGPDLVARRRWRPRARSASTSTSRGSRCARPTWSPSRSWSPSRRSGCSASCEPDARRRGARACARSGRSTAPRSARSPTPGACACCAATRSSATCRSTRSSTTARSTTSRRRARRRRGRSTRRPRRRSRPGASPARRAARAAGLAEHRLAPAALRAVRLRSCSRAPCAGPRRPTPRCSRCPDGSAIAVSIDGNGRKVAADPYTRDDPAALECASNLACVGAEPLGHDEQPELRQPREAAHRLAAHRGRARPRRRVPRAARRRSSAATSRSTTRAPTARSTRRRSSAWSARCPTRARAGRLGFAREGDASALAGWNRPPSLAASELAKLRGERAARRAAARSTSSTARGAGRDPRRGARAATWPPATTSPRAASSWRVAEACLLGGRRRRGARPRRRATAPWTDELLFGEDAGGFVVSGPREALERLGERIPLDVFGTVGRRRPRRSTRAPGCAGRSTSCAPPTARWRRSSPSRRDSCRCARSRKGGHRGDVPRTWNAISPSPSAPGGPAASRPAAPDRPGPPRPRRPGERRLALRGRLRVGRLLRLEPGPDGGRRHRRRPERGRRDRRGRGPALGDRDGGLEGLRPQDALAVPAGAHRQRRLPRLHGAHERRQRPVLPPAGPERRPRGEHLPPERQPARSASATAARTSRPPASSRSARGPRSPSTSITARHEQHGRGAPQRDARLHDDDREPRHRRRPDDPDRQRHGRAGLHAARPTTIDVQGVRRHDAVRAGQRDAADGLRDAAGRADADREHRAPGPAPSRSPTRTSGSAATRPAPTCAAIAGRHAATYAVTAADVGDTLRVAVTATNSVGPTTATSNATAVVQGASLAPANTVAADDHRHAAGRADPDRRSRRLDGHPADHLRVRVAALRQRRRDLRADPGATGSTLHRRRRRRRQHAARRGHRDQRGGQRHRARPRPPRRSRATQTQPGLVALWHMDETSGTSMADAVGGHTGTLHSVALGQPGSLAPPTASTGSSYVSVPTAARPQPRRVDDHGHDPAQDDLGARHAGLGHHPQGPLHDRGRRVEDGVPAHRPGLVRLQGLVGLQPR